MVVCEGLGVCILLGTDSYTCCLQLNSSGNGISYFMPDKTVKLYVLSLPVDQDSNKARVRHVVNIHIHECHTVIMNQLL